MKKSAIVALVLPLSACSVSGNSSSTSDAGSKIITLVTHNSWTPDKSVMAEFTKQSGYSVKVVTSGDAGALANKLVLTKNNPQGDVVFGIDTTFASRVSDAGVLQNYRSAKAPASASAFDLPQGKEQLAPIDFGDVCVNLDDAWFTKHKIVKPMSLDDLLKPTYKNLMVTEGASTSSPGMGFFLATEAKYGNAWPQYWAKLVKNGVKIDSGWDDVWNVDYTAGSKGRGTRPIAVSYDTSPADTVNAAGKPTTSAMLSSCFRSVEYAGVLKGAKNADGARAFIDFLYEKAFQQSLPESMYVMPVDRTVALPKTWSSTVKIAEKPLSVDPATINAHREQWLTQWQDVTSR